MILRFKTRLSSKGRKQKRSKTGWKLKSVGCGFFRVCAKNSSNKTSFDNHQVDYFTRKNIKKFQNPFKDVFQNKNTQTNVINRMINNLRPDLTTQLFNDKRIKIE